jgi:pimeloyl-ACP methyl ester carboxylesterase
MTIDRTDTRSPGSHCRRPVFLPTGRLFLHAAKWPGPADVPPALVLHGIFESWRTFAPLAAELADNRTVYCLDLRGHGASDRPTEGYRFADYAADILGVLDGLSARFPEVDLVGHSLGANVALYAAAAGHPALGRVVVVDPPILRDEDWPGLRAAMRHEWWLARRPLNEIVASLAGARARDESWLRMIAAALTDTADGVFEAMVDGEQEPVDWASVLKPISVPVLAVAPDPGESGGQLVGARLAEFRTALPGAQVVVVPGAGHHVELDRPAELRRLVDAFLRR